MPELPLTSLILGIALTIVAAGGLFLLAIFIGAGILGRRG